MGPYALARKALLLAEELEPDGRLTQRLLAKCDQISGDFDRSYGRLTGLIDSMMIDKPQPTTNLFFARHLRGRVAFLWAEREKLKGVSNGEKNLRRLRVAVADLGQCDQTLSKSKFDKDQTGKRYHVLRDQLRAMVNLAEVELNLRLPDAEQHFKQAQQWLELLSRFIDDNHLTVSALTDLEYRVTQGLSHFQGKSVASQP